MGQGCLNEKNINMKSRFLVFLFICACASDNFSNKNPQTALRRARLACTADQNDMEWFETLLNRMQQEVTAEGRLYMGRVDGIVYFIHQPLMMSCLACVVYDCTGTRVELSQESLPKLQSLISQDNIIYSNVEE